MDKLTAQWGTNVAVPTKFDLDFLFSADVDDSVVHGLDDIFNKLNAYEKNNQTPNEQAQMIREYKELEEQYELLENVYKSKCDYE